MFTEHYNRNDNIYIYTECETDYIIPDTDSSNTAECFWLQI